MEYDHSALNVVGPGMGPTSPLPFRSLQQPTAHAREHHEPSPQAQPAWPPPGSTTGGSCGRRYALAPRLGKGSECEGRRRQDCTPEGGTGALKGAWWKCAGVPKKKKKKKNGREKEAHRAMTSPVELQVRPSRRGAVSARRSQVETTEAGGCPSPLF